MRRLVSVLAGAALLTATSHPAMASFSTCVVEFDSFQGRVEVEMDGNPTQDFYTLYDANNHAEGIAYNNSIAAQFYITPGHESTSYSVKGPNPSTTVVSTCNAPSSGYPET